jgi:hypothetical protein
MDKSQTEILSVSGEQKTLAIDTLTFRDDGKESFPNDPRQNGVRYCKHCKAWHAKLQLDMGTKFCAFCFTTHHSRACASGLGEKCKNPAIDPIHGFLTRECHEHQRFDLSFCRECNCFHSKQGWKICLRNNRPERGWSEERRIIWQIRCRASNSLDKRTIRRERSLFNMAQLIRAVPHEYPFSNGRFIHQCNL